MRYFSPYHNEILYQFFLPKPIQVKKDARTGKSRGFGFVRYGDRMVQANVFDASHTIKGRRVELKYPKQVSFYP